MTAEEIDAIFPPNLAGLAQISDLRLLLSRLALGEYLGGGGFFEVLDIPEMEALEDIRQGDICLVALNNIGQPETFIYSEDQWKTMVIVPIGGGGGTSYVKLSEEFTIVALDVVFQEIALVQTPTIYEHMFVFLNGMLLSKDEYNVVGNTIQFIADTIYINDTVVVKYSYQP